MHTNELGRTCKVVLRACRKKRPKRRVQGMGGRIASAGIFKQSKGARNRVGIGFSYRAARLVRLHSLAELVPSNRFLD